MLNVIIYEDNAVFMQKNINSVNKALANCDIDYRILKFNQYSSKLEDAIYQKDVKKNQTPF